MNEQIAEILLQEFRTFRAEVSAWKQDTGERVATLETQMTEVRGNGQPGRLGRVEATVEILKQFRWKIIGYAGAVCGAITLLGIVINVFVRWRS